MRGYKFTEENFTTKAASQAAFLRLLKPLRPFYSEGGARLEIGATSAHYENDTVPMEAFARVLWGLAPFWKGLVDNAENIANENSWIYDFEKIYQNGLTAGSDPSHPEYWHTCHDFDQKFCEMPAIGFAMLIAPEKVWDPLSDQAQENLTEWLWEVNRHECCACNWHWFAILTNVALKVRGAAYSKERIEYGFEMLESYYDAGGWYRDGSVGGKDYYNAYVMHSFGMLYAMFMEEEEPERCAKLRARAVEFAQDYRYWFAEDGASIAYGRSMTYKFAQCGFWAIALLTGTEVLPLPVMKGILTRNLVWWLNQPIFDNAGILTIGYAYPNLQMAESYNAPGSPYWAFMAFAFLALPEDHPYWQAECAPMPTLHRQQYLENAGMLVQRNHNNVVAFVSGRTHSDGHSHSLEKYAKFVYSSRFGFSVAKSPLSLSECAADSTLTFEIAGHFYPKDTTEGYTISKEGITCAWSPLPGAKAGMKMPCIHVETEIRLTEKGHIRTHTITSDIACVAYDSGFALAADKMMLLPDYKAGGNVPQRRAESGGEVPGEKNDNYIFQQKAQDNYATVKSRGDYCTVTALRGDGKGMVIAPDPNTNLIVSKTWLPMVAYQIKEGKQVIKTEVNYL